MSPHKWDALYDVNNSVNLKIKSVEDLKLYGERERWAIPVTAGDCEDYVLLKKRKLVKLGFPPWTLRIAIVLDEMGQGHAVLIVKTDEGDYALDNRRNDILLWNNTNYTFLKMQSKKSPIEWSALLKRPTSPKYEIAQ